jgi:hypothetical protein
MVATRESSALAKVLIGQTCAKQGIRADVPRFSRGLSRRLRLLRVGAVGQAE